MSIQRLQSHWGFTRMLFGRDLAPAMLHRHANHGEAVARISWCVDQRAIGVITGEVGADAQQRGQVLENVSMNSSEASDVAWGLVEHGRAALTVAELNTVFVRLGIGEDADAIEIVLKAVVRNGGPPLPRQLIVRLTRWAELCYRDEELRVFLEMLSRVGADSPPTAH